MHPALTEWWVNGLGGLEQGFALVDATGVTRLHYNGLIAHDRDGVQLPAWFETEAGRLVMHVDDRGAAYPIVVDPWIEHARLLASDGAANDTFGSIALSADSLIVGAPSYSAGRSCVYVFLGPGATWTDVFLHAARLRAKDPATDPRSVGVWRRGYARTLR